MRVFVTGASGHIGSAVVPELLNAGHEVVGLARSDASAEALEAAGAEVRRGDLEDVDGLAEAAAASDGVIHLAYRHELMRTGEMERATADDRRAIEAIGDALDGSGKPFVGTSGTLLLAVAGINDRAGTEEDAVEGPGRVANENALIALADRQVRSSVVRLTPTVHSSLDKHGFVSGLIGMAREHGVSGYLGDGENRWPAVHTLDAAHLYRLALERAKPGTRLHAVADEGVPFREIAAAIGRGLDVPVESFDPDTAAERFSYLAGFVGLDGPASSALTREWLRWEPTHASLIPDIDEGHYFAQPASLPVS
jgi:nucleoside-diphosphate-sugar epimerase